MFRLKSMGIAVFITQYHIYGLSLNIKNKICRIYLVLDMRNKYFYFLTLFPYPPLLSSLIKALIHKFSKLISLQPNVEDQLILVRNIKVSDLPSGCKSKRKL